MDRRLTPANDRVALTVLRGMVTAAHFTDGTPGQLAVPLADLLKAPDGPRERQLLMGDALTVIERHQGWAFVQAAKDGYCGYLPEGAVGAREAVTHWVATPGTHLYAGPKVQAQDLGALSLGCRVTVTGQSGAFAQTPQGFVPANHLRVLGDWQDDPVTVAESFLGTPYLWGGNSRAGIDCSGLTQVAHLACGIACPADSDQQQAMGHALPEEAPLQRGDLLFWKGHVAMVAAPDLMIHATGHAMAVVFEPIRAGIARIEGQSGGPVTHRRRLAG